MMRPTERMRLRGVSTADPGRKRHRDGTHRTLPPEATLVRVLKLAPALGITRLSTVTGLDRLGVPVAVACRPNSRSLAVFQGKGLTLAAAKASAFMEALEAFHAETVTGPLRFAGTRELRATARVAEPGRLPRCSGGAWDEERPLLWFEAVSLATGEPIWVPFELVGARFTAPQPPASMHFAASTNGLASGNHPLEAILHGLYETIERDAIALWLCRGRERRRSTSMAPPVSAGAAGDLLARCAAASVRVSLWDATSDLGVAVIVCLMRGIDESVVDMGSGCHADRDVALLRAITEAAQSRLTRISGAREDFGDEAYPADPAPGNDDDPRFPAVPRRVFEAVPSFAGDTLRADLARTVARVMAAGFDEIAVADLTRPEFGVPVVRVIVPGLEGPAHSLAVEYVPGARARAAAA